MTAEQLTRDYEDKRLKIDFVDGKTAEVLVHMVTNCDQHEDCRGIIYDLIAGDLPVSTGKESSYWTELKYIKNFEVMGAMN